MKRLIIIWMTLIATFSLFGAKNQQTPDFAFPEKVAKNAATDLDRALQNSDGQATIDALVRLGLAKSLVSTDSLPNVINKIKTVMQTEKNPATKSLLNILLAKIYTDIYQHNRYTYNQRETVADNAATAEDYTLWSRNQFLKKVTDLTSEAVADPTTLKEIQLTEYPTIIRSDEYSRLIYPTLYDFIAIQAINCLDSFDNGEQILNIGLLSTPENATLYPIIPNSPIRRILNLYSSIIASHNPESASAAFNTIYQLEYIREHVFSASWQETNRQFNNTMNRLRATTPDSQYTIEYLLAQNDGLDDREKTDLYNSLKAFAKHNSGYFNINTVKNRMTELSTPSFDFQTPRIVTPATDFKYTLKCPNAPQCVIKIYDISRYATSADDNYYNIRKGLPAPCDTISINLGSEIPGYNYRTEATYRLPKFGRYLMIPLAPGQKPAGSYPVIFCSNLAAATVSGIKNMTAYTVNPLTGQPEQNAEILFRPWSRKTDFTLQKDKTDNNGLLTLDLKESGLIVARRGDDRFSPSNYLYNFEDRENQTRLYGECFTSLSLYHPGDTVNFSTVIYEHNNNKNTLASHRNLKVIMRDANYQEAGTTTLTTDDWGRAEGAIRIPAEGLTGYFHLEVMSDDRHITSRSFTVSDYKLPTFMIETTAVNRPATISDPASISGKATAFSGFPVGDAKVEISLKVRAGRWPWSPLSPTFHTSQTSTDASGEFTIEIPADAIQASPAPRGIFIADIAITSPDGETQTVSTTFNLGTPLTISTSVPSVINTAQPINASVVTINSLGQSVESRLNYHLESLTSNNETETKTTIASGEITTGSIAGILQELPTGRYVISFSAVDSVTAEATEPATFITYHPNDSICPVDTPLWIPEYNLTADSDGTATIVFGSNTDNAHILMIVSDPKGKIITTEWHTTKAGMQEIQIKMPTDSERLTVQLSSVWKFKSFTETLTIRSLQSTRSIKINAETFRDKVTPGTKETITFRITPTEGTSAESAVILDMANMAIDKLSQNSLTFNTVGNFFRTHNFTAPKTDIANFSFTKQLKRLKTVDISQPILNLYGLSGFISNNIRIRGTSRFYKMASTMAINEDKVEEEITTIEECADMAVAQAPTAGSGAASKVDCDSGTVTAETTSPETTQYRPSEIPLAFFRPMLTTDADGTLEVTYTVPDANTTWLLRAMAYNRELLSANTSLSIMASKPVMVNLNAPRFLRTADKITLFASVMNNSDSIATVSTICEILDAATGKLIATTTSTDTIPAMGRTIVEIPYTASADLTAVIFRVKGTAAEFTDGEQSLIQILPSSQDVIESKIFYIAPDSAHFSLDIDAALPGSRSFLQFTENPTWQVVSALQGLRDNKINSSVEAAAALFSACIADGLMQTYPEIARTLRRWAENPADSALVSNLQKNTELKSLLLTATPWVSAAMNDTERMQRLALLLDSRETEAARRKAIADLSKTAVGNGGWAWTKQYPEVSEWCTYQILDMLGDLNRLGWLPKDENLNKMIKNACTYIDIEVSKRYAKSPKSDFTHYVYTRDKFPGIKRSTAATRVTNTTVQRSIANWKEHSQPAKAIDALILNSNGYNATARQILQSLREYATTTPEKGMWWQQLDRMSVWSMDRVGLTAIILDAFAAVEPGCADIDKIRQWLILQKGNTDWGSGIITSQVISSILTSGTRWTVNPTGTAIRIGETLVEPSKTEYATGTFTTPITEMLGKPATLTIDRQANYPSFGAVITLRHAQMDEISAIGCSELTITKQLCVFNGTEWIPANEFKSGDRVRVDLVVKADTDIDYVVIQDLRAAGLEPAEQLPTPIWAEGLRFYRENRDSQTNIFINRLPRGTYRLSYELFASQNGTFASGVAEIQSQYNPAIAAHSAGENISIK